MDSAVEPLVSEYIGGLSYVKSVDGFLIKTSTLIFSIEDYCGKTGCDPSVLLQGILRRGDVSRYLKAFACYRDNIRSAVSSDPRYKNLRKYIDVIDAVLGELGCEKTVSAKIMVQTPPALWVKESRLERAEAGSHRETGIHGGLGRRGSRERVMQVLLALLASSIILLIIYALLR